MILLVDNYDSFSYNLVQLAGSINPDIQVIRNDAMTVEAVEGQKPSHIILSPGPGYPKDAGICEEIVKKLGGRIPILGVCLGHQGICEVFGAKICLAKQLMHGKKSLITVDNTSNLFQGLPRQIEAARYHSLIAERDTAPEELQIIAEAEDGEIMAVRHRNMDIYGVQFHPESILSPQGRTIMENFLNL